VRVVALEDGVAVAVEAEWDAVVRIMVRRENK
jgi:hypothetical protein